MSGGRRNVSRGFTAVIILLAALFACGLALTLGGVKAWRDRPRIPVPIRSDIGAGLGSLILENG